MEDKYEEDEDDFSNSRPKLSFIVACCFITLLFLQWFVRLVLYGSPTTELVISPEKHFLLKFLLEMHPLIAGGLSGFTTLFVCWALTYFNWLNVGSFPPTPLSPTSPRGRLQSPPNSPTSPTKLGLASLTPFMVSIATSYLVWSLVATESSNATFY
ncbi:uncharacterized protein LOC100182238 [Ciona intestinalis]